MIEEDKEVTHCFPCLKWKKLGTSYGAYLSQKESTINLDMYMIFSLIFTGPESEHIMVK